MPRKARGVRGERVVEEIGDELESRVGVQAPSVADAPVGETSQGFPATGEPEEHFRREESGEALFKGRPWSLRGGVATGREEEATGEEELDVVITMGAALVGRGGAGVAGMTPRGLGILSVRKTREEIALKIGRDISEKSLDG